MALKSSTADLLRETPRHGPVLNRVHSSELVQHPKLILIINPMDSLLAKDTRRHEAMAAEEAIRELITSDIPVIGCMSPGAFLLMETKSEWDQLFDVYRIPEPDPARIVEILHEHRTEFSEHYNGITISDEALEEVTLSLTLLSDPKQPRRSVQFSAKFVRAVTLSPPVTHLIETVSKKSSLAHYNLVDLKPVNLEMKSMSSSQKKSLGKNPSSENCQTSSPLGSQNGPIQIAREACSFSVGQPALVKPKRPSNWRRSSVEIRII